MTTTIEGALDMLAEAQDLTVRLQAVAARAASAFADLSGGLDVDHPTQVQRVLMEVASLR